MKNLKPSLEKVMPRTEQETGQIAEMLEGFMTESFLDDATFEMDKNTNLESEKILSQRQLQEVLIAKCLLQYQQILKKQLTNFSNFKKF